MGKVLGAMIGLSAGLLGQSGAAAIVLAVIGAAVGHFYDTLHRPPETSPLDDLPVTTPTPAEPREPRTALPPPEREPEPRPDPLIEDLCELFASVASADGEVNGEEVRAIKRYFEDEPRFGDQSPEQVRLGLKRAISQAKPESTDHRPLPTDHPPETTTTLTSAEKLGLLDALFEIALADGAMTRSERDAVKRAASRAGVPDLDYRRVAELHFGGGGEHFAALGLDASATDEDIKRAFRQLAAALHPDRAAHLPRDEQETSAARFRAVKDAYDRLRELRGF